MTLTASIIAEIAKGLDNDQVAAELQAKGIACSLAYIRSIRLLEQNKGNISAHPVKKRPALPKEQIIECFKKGMNNTRTYQYLSQQGIAVTIKQVDGIRFRLSRKGITYPYEYYNIESSIKRKIIAQMRKHKTNKEIYDALTKAGVVLTYAYVIEVRTIMKKKGFEYGPKAIKKKKVPKAVEVEREYDCQPIDEATYAFFEKAYKSISSETYANMAYAMSKKRAKD